MSLLDRLIDQLHTRGLTVAPGDKPGELKLCGAVKEATPELMRALRAFKPQLLARFGKTEVVPEPAPAPPATEPEACAVCGRDVSDPEDKARLADPAFCDRGGNRAATDGYGGQHQGGERCPYKRAA